MRAQRLAVVGTGPVGAALVAALRHRTDLQLVWIGDSPPAVAARIGDDARVIACSPFSRQLLAQLGAWELMDSDRLCDYRAMQVWDEEGTGRIHFGDGETPLGHIVELTLIGDALDRVVKRDSPNGLELCVPDRLVGLVRGAEGVQLSLASGREIHVDLVCGADGADSTVRHLTGFEVTDYPCGQTAITAVVRHEGDHLDTAWQSFLATGPLAFLPLAKREPGFHQSAIVWSLDDDQADGVKQLADDDFLTRLSRHAPAPIGRLLEVGQRIAFPLTQRLARTYCQPGVVLVGDAAHRIHPLAGQGANLGFADVAVLAAELNRALDRSVAIGDMSVLRRYQRQRRWQNDAMATAMTAFRRGFGLSDPYLRTARNGLMHLVDRQSRLKVALQKKASGM